MVCRSLLLGKVGKFETFGQIAKKPKMVLDSAIFAKKIAATANPDRYGYLIRHVIRFFYALPKEAQLNHPYSDLILRWVLRIAFGF